MKINSLTLGEARPKEAPRLSSPRHIDELQTLRGLAALVVVISHVSTVYALKSSTRVEIDSILNAHASVVVFFVLSGYVLAGSLRRRGLTLPGVIAFYVARLFRLFPALWVASGLSMLLLIALPQFTIKPPVSTWMEGYLHGMPPIKTLFFALLSLNNTLVMPVGTIFIELLGSLAMPLFVFLDTRNPRIFRALIVVAGFSAYPLSSAPHRLDNLAYLFEFALGAFLASVSPSSTVIARRLPLILPLSVLILFRCIWFAVQQGHLMPLQFGYNAPSPAIWEALAASVLVSTLAAGQGEYSLINHRALIWLGDVSYGLYLLHFPIAIAGTKLMTIYFQQSLSPLTAACILLAFTIPVSLLLSYLIYTWIEAPSNALGKRISSHIAWRSQSPSIALGPSRQ